MTERADEGDAEIGRAVPMEQHAAPAHGTKGEREAHTIGV